MSNRRKRKGLAPPPEDPIEFAKIFRRACWRCGSANLVWQTGREILAEDPQRLVDLAPTDVPWSVVLAGACWTCQDCSDGAIFLAPQ